jgi:hypothetical protein
MKAWEIRERATTGHDPRCKCRVCKFKSEPCDGRGGAVEYRDGSCRCMGCLGQDPTCKNNRPPRDCLAPRGDAA